MENRNRKIRQLTTNEKKDYDYVKSVFITEKNSPKVPTWKICDIAMDTFNTNIETQKSAYTTTRSNIIKEFSTVKIDAINTSVKTFTSTSLNKVVAVVDAKNITANSNVLKAYDVIVKVTTGINDKVTIKSVMMKNDIVNNKIADFYGFKLVSVNQLSLQKIYNSYVTTANAGARIWGEPVTYPVSLRIGTVYYIEL